MIATSQDLSELNRNRAITSYTFKIRGIKLIRHIQTYEYPNICLIYYDLFENYVAV